MVNNIICIQDSLCCTAALDSVNLLISHLISVIIIRLAYLMRGFLETKELPQMRNQTAVNYQLDWKKFSACMLMVSLV